MAIHTNYSSARENLAELWDTVEKDHEQVIISRRGHEDLVLIKRSELDSMEETAHLLRSPANAIRLLEALLSSMEGRGTPFTVEELRAEFGLVEEEK